MLLVCLLAGRAAGVPQATGQQAPPAGADLAALRAAMARFDWPDETVATLRDFFERTHVDELLDGLQEPAPRPLRLADVLASLPAGDWQAPFRYVQRRIAFVPYRGVVRGALGTLATGAGNALDRTLLLRELYRALGVPTRLVRGRLRWDDAVRLIGTPPPRPPGPGDPWLRWVESVADHWWLEVRHEGRWQPLDTAFPEALPGRAVGRRRGVAEEVPPELRARVTVAVTVEERTLLRRSLPVEELLFRPVELDVEPLPSAQVVAAGAAVAAEGTEAGAAPPLSDRRSGRALLDPPAAGAAAGQEDPLAPVLPRYGDGPLTLRLAMAGAVDRIEGVEREALEGVHLAVRVGAPGGPASAVDLPWPGGVGGRLVALAAVGPVPRAVRLASVRPVWEVMSELADAEQTALLAWQARPEP